MPRIRTIKPQFWFDEQLGGISREARLLYIGLWNLSDDQGVFEWRPMQIKAQIFPYDKDIKPDDIEKWLGQLQEIGNVRQFSAEGHSYGYIPTFLKHQEIKNPSQWRYVHGDLKQFMTDLPTPTPVLPQQGGSPTPALPLGSREKEKEKEKEKESIRGKSAPVKQKFGQFLNVFLTTQEYEKLKLRFNNQTEEKIEELSEALKSKTGYDKKYTDHYATILSWDRRDKKNGTNQLASGTGTGAAKSQGYDYGAGRGGPGAIVHRP